MAAGSPKVALQTALGRVRISEGPLHADATVCRLKGARKYLGGAMLAPEVMFFSASVRVEDFPPSPPLCLSLGTTTWSSHGASRGLTSGEPGLSTSLLLWLSAQHKGTKSSVPHYASARLLSCPPTYILQGGSRRQRQTISATTPGIAVILWRSRGRTISATIPNITIAL